MISHGRKNIVFGFIYIIFTLILGIVLSINMKDPQWASKPFDFPRVVMRAAHAHGNLESVLNIISGLVLDRISVTDSLKKIISIMLITGAVMHSGILYIAPVLPNLMPLTIIGALSLIVSMILMAYGAIKGIK